MNKKSKQFENIVIDLFLNNKLSIGKISKKLKCSTYVINRILKDFNIDKNLNTVSLYNKYYNDILILFNDTNNIRTLLQKFPRRKDIIYDFLASKNIEINDKLILDIFIVDNRVDNTYCIAKPTIKYFNTNKNNNIFIKKVIDYLENRYNDSESLSETIARIYNKIEIRPTCKQCNNKLKYYSLNQPFQLFCSRLCANNNEETKLHLQQTCLKKYGVTNTAKAEITKQHYREHMEQKYGKGIINAWQAKEVITKSERTKLDKYGTITYNNRNKAERTCLNKYGVKTTSQISDVRKKQQFRYIYNFISFDSAPEIAFYIWLNDIKDILDIDFEYSPNIKFEYKCNNKVHFYMPDFRIENQYFEIKGNQFFKDGKMINPYRNKSWSDKQYQHICDIYEAKYQCMLRNNINIITADTYNFFLDYVKQNYGKNYLKQFKNNQKK